MPGSRYRVGQVVVERKAIEIVALHPVVGGQYAHHDLDSPEDDGNEEKLYRGALGRRRLMFKEGICRWIGSMHDDFFLRGVPPDEATNTSEQANETQDAPQYYPGRRSIGDERLMRPIVRVGCRRARTVGTGGPGRPPEEFSEFMLLRVVRERIFRDGILRAAACKHVGVISRELPECSNAIGIDDDAMSRGIIGVRSYFTNEASLEYGLLIHTQSGEVRGSVPDCPDVEQYLRLAMQPVGSPVRSDIRSVAPHGADLLPANRLPDTLAICNGTAGEEKLSVRGVDIRKGRSLTDHLPPFTSEYSKRCNNDNE